GEEGFIYQRLYTLPGAGDRRPVWGSWVVDGDPAGMGIREDGPITGNAARFVPHIIG
ncbi:glutathionylspermidine synthase family protein, partial [Pseudoalteromonas sp. NZS100_1]|nr:glutathionylspermidine synthase family protein [Pseudoalteromonas sp. NZS100_1]